MVLCLSAHTVAMADVPSFVETILDARPLASDRINDVSVADINGDGLPDVWVSGRNGEDHQSAWYRNPGDRQTVWKRYPFARGSWKYGELGDVDGDGDIDLVAGYDLEKKVYWLENDGFPERAPWQRHFLGITGAPDQILIRDLDGDGRMEIVALYKNGPIRILRRPEDKTAAWKETTIADVMRSTAGGSIGDVDNDGDLDIVFGNSWHENPAPAKDWTTGSNWRRHIVDRRWPRESRSVVADIDGDGRNDLLLCAEESDHGASWYRLFGSASSGEWVGAKVNRRTYSKLHTCQVADFNGDGRLDVLVAEMHTSAWRRVTVFLQGKRDGEWVESIVSTTGSHNAKIADVDGNGVPDIVGKNYEGDMRPRIWFGRITKEKLPLGGWRRYVLAKGLPYQATFIRAGDVSGDGRVDIVAGGWWWKNPGDIGAKWERHEFGGGLKNAAVLYDFDANGSLDVVGTSGMVRGGQLHVGLNSGNGRFLVKRVGRASRGDFLQGAAVGRLDGDGVQVVLSWHNGARASPRIGTEWLRVPKDVSRDWKLEKLSEFSNEEDIALGDIDGDGRLDIHLGSHWLRNSGSGRFDLKTGMTVTAGSVDRLRLADIDNDGDLDVVAGFERTRKLAWAENGTPGNGRPWKVHPIAAEFLHMSLNVGDIDGDGDIDVVSGAHRGRGEVVIYENSRNGMTWNRHIVDRGAPDVDHHMGTHLVDLDADGDLDIISVGWNPTSVTIYENLPIGTKRERNGALH
jgi:hypothetical protein